MQTSWRAGLNNLPRPRSADTDLVAYGNSCGSVERQETIAKDHVCRVPTGEGDQLLIACDTNAVQVESLERFTGDFMQDRALSLARVPVTLAVQPVE